MENEKMDLEKRRTAYVSAYDAAITALVPDFDPAADKETASPWCLADYSDAIPVDNIEMVARAYAEKHAPEIAKLLADDFQNRYGYKRIVIVNDGQYDIYDLENFYDIFGRVERALAHDWDAIQSAYLEADDMMTFADFEKLIEKYEPIKNLDDLYIKMLKNHPSVMYKGGWSSDLPNFGGEEPSDTNGVWSWDETRLIVGTCSHDIRIVSRDEYRDE